MTEFEDILEDVADESARKTAEEWRDEAITTLRQVGERVDYDVEPVVNSATPVTQGTDGYTFTFTHPASAIFEFGSDPHTITGTKEEPLIFQQNGETVYATEVEHPGTDAILFVSKSQQRITERGLREQIRQ